MLTHRKLFPQLHGTAALVYDVMTARFNRSESIEFSRADLLKFAKMTAPTLRQALDGLARLGLIFCTKEVELLHPETSEPIPSEPHDVESEAELRFFDPRTGQKRRLEFTPEIYEIYYRQSLPRSDVWHPGNNAHCPFHNDSNPSLSINVNDGVWFCHACGEGGGIIDFEMRLQGSEDKHETWRRISQKLGLRPCPPSRGLITHRHAYLNEQGDTLYWVYRYEDGSARFLHELNHKLRPGLGSARRTLYNLPQVLAADTVLITEGEKKADVVTALGLKDRDGKPVAVTTTGAANSWKIDFADVLAGKRIIILPDTDIPGRRYAESIAASLSRLDITFVVLDFDGYGNDVRDFLKERSGADLIDSSALIG